MFGNIGFLEVVSIELQGTEPPSGLEIAEWKENLGEDVYNPASCLGTPPGVFLILHLPPADPCPVIRNCTAVDVRRESSGSELCLNQPASLV